jgi:GNAT superfamily N-acetyltransferase
VSDAVKPSLVIRRIRPSDRDLLPAFYAGLSDESRYARFLGTARLSDEATRSFCTPDHMHDEGFVAILASDSGHRLVGHLCLEPAGKRRLELAVAVSDDVQGKGIGRRLMDAAHEWAGARHFEAILASAFATNSAVLRLLSAAPYPVHVTPAVGGVVDVVIPLVAELLPNQPVVVPPELLASRRAGRASRQPLTVSRCSRVFWRCRRPPGRGAGD